MNTNVKSYEHKWNLIWNLIITNVKSFEHNKIVKSYEYNKISFLGKSIANRSICSVNTQAGVINAMTICDQNRSLAVSNASTSAKGNIVFPF